MDEVTIKTPVHLWIVGILSLLWSLFGGYDYIMSQTQNREYLASIFTEPGQVDTILTYMESFPLWAEFGWGLGVWGAVAGSVLLLMRHRWAVIAFGASLVGALLGIGYQLVDPSMPEFLKEGAAAIMPYVVLVIAIFLFLYARAMRAKNVLN